MTEHIAVVNCRENCWCKNVPHKFADMYEALRPLHDIIYEFNPVDTKGRIERLESMLKIHLDKYTKTNNDIQERMRKCEKILFSRNPHKCPICLGRRVVENREVDECRACHATGIVWG